VLVATQGAEGRHVEVERCRGPDVELHPRDRDRTQEVTVRKRKDSAVDCGCLRGERKEVPRPPTNLLGRFSTRAPVFIELPAWMQLLNLLCCLALVLAVIDLPKQGRQLRLGETRDLCSSPGSLEWTRIHRIEMDFPQAVLQRCRLLLTVRGEW
jgi:hypothetical protein